MASMASRVVPLEWLNLMVAEPKRGDDRADGLTLKIEGALTVAFGDGFGGGCVDGSCGSIDGFDGTDSFVGFDGGFDGTVGGLVGFDGFDGGVIGLAEVHDRAKKR